MNAYKMKGEHTLKDGMMVKCEHGLLMAEMVPGAWEVIGVVKQHPGAITPPEENKEKSNG
jgi:hypothetical protein